MISKDERRTEKNYHKVKKNGGPKARRFNFLRFRTCALTIDTICQNPPKLQTERASLGP